MIPIRFLIVDAVFIHIASPHSEVKIVTCETWGGELWKLDKAHSLTVQESGDEFTVMWFIQTPEGKGVGCEHSLMHDRSHIEVTFTLNG